MKNKLFLLLCILPLLANAQISTVTEAQKQQALQTVSKFCSLFTQWANGQRTLDAQIYALCSGNDCSAYDDVSTNKETTLRNYLLGIQKKYPKSLAMQISQPSLTNSSITYEPNIEMSSYVGNIDGTYSPETMIEIPDFFASSYKNAYIVFKVDHSISTIGKTTRKMIIYDVKASKISAFITGETTFVNFIEGINLMTKKDYKGAIPKFEAAAVNERSSIRNSSFRLAALCCVFLGDMVNMRRFVRLTNDTILNTFFDAYDKVMEESYSESMELFLKCERLIKEERTGAHNNLLSTVYFECGLLYGMLTDYKKAVYYLKKAIDLGSVQSAFWLWEFCMGADEIDDTIISGDEIVRYLKWAAEKGHQGAILLVAKFEESQQNVNDAITWYEKGAKMGDVLCMACLGRLLLQKDKSTASMAKEWLEKSLEGNKLEQQLKGFDGLISSFFWPNSRADVQKLLNETQSSNTTTSSTTLTHISSSSTNNNVSSSTTVTTTSSSSHNHASSSNSSSSSNYSYKYRRHKFNQAKDNYIGGFSVGYIQKQWTYEENGEKEKFGLFDDDKYLQGIQAGFRVDPQFGAGFGMNSGLFYEYCWAKSEDEIDLYGTYHYTYEEHGLYLPLHLKFTMNFSKWFQLSIYGGVGLNYVMSGYAYMRGDGETYGSENVFSEEDDWKRFNTMLEYGVSIRISALQIDFTQSQGLNNWSDTDGIKMKQGRPLSISATICF